MPPLVEPPGATVSYNGIVFNTSALYRSRVSAKPIPSDSNRSVRFVEYRIEIEGPVMVSPPDGATDVGTTIALWRKRLTQPGGALAYSGKGMGSFYVNTAEFVVWDAAWGPWPVEFDIQSLGDRQAVWIRWAVVTKIPECDLAQFTKGITAFDFSVSWEIDTDGYTRMTTAGMIEVPISKTAVNDRSVPRSADGFREKIRPEVPLGFQRKDQRFTLSMDRRRLDFQFVDEEIPAPLPDGITQAPVTQNVRSNLARDGLVNWTITFSGTITTAAGVPRSFAWYKFMVIVGSRIRRYKTVMGVINAPIQNVSNDNRKVGQLLPVEYDFTEEIMGRSSSFRLTFLAVGITLKKILEVSGLWTAISGTDFTRWRGSLAGSAFGVRGFAGLKFDPSQEVIVDLCTTRQPKPELYTPGGSPGPQPQPPPPLPEQPPVDPDRSWLRYVISFLVLNDAGVVVHKPLRAAVPPPAGLSGGQLGITGGGQKSLTKGGAVPPVPAASPQQLPGDPPDITQRPTGVTYTIIMILTAKRLGYPIPIPQLVSYGGAPVIQASGRYVFNESARIPLAGVSINYVRYESVYIVTDKLPVGKVPEFDNPLFDEAEINNP